MATGKQLAQFAIYPVAMPAAVGLCLWVLLGPLHIGQPAGYPVPVAAPAATPEPAPAAIPEPAPASTPEPKPADPEITSVPGYSGRLMTPMRDALARKGYWAGPAGADGGDNMLTALEAFQDNAALPVQPKCDQQCQTALGLPGPE